MNFCPPPTTTTHAVKWILPPGRGPGQRRDTGPHSFYQGILSRTSTQKFHPEWLLWAAEMLLRAAETTVRAAEKTARAAEMQAAEMPARAAEVPLRAAEMPLWAAQRGNQAHMAASDGSGTAHTSKINFPSAMALDLRRTAPHGVSHRG
jgi:hypothetical protein